MANHLDTQVILQIASRLRAGEPRRRIARDLRLNRETVSRYAKLLGFEGEADLDPGRPRLSSAPCPADLASIERILRARRSAARRSRSEPFRAFILDKARRGWEATRIHDALVRQCGFRASYFSVRRYVRSIRLSEGLPPSSPSKANRRRFVSRELAAISKSSGEADAGSSRRRSKTGRNWQQTGSMLQAESPALSPTLST